MAGAPRSGGGIRNTIDDGTVGVVVQAGDVKGDLHVHYGPAAGGRPDGAGEADDSGAMTGRAEPLSAARLTELVELLLAVPGMSTPNFVQLLLDSMPVQVAHAVPRQASARVDALSLLRTCENYERAWDDLVSALRLVAPGARSVERFAATAAAFGLIARA